MIIDVREMFEFASGHAPEARNIPLADLEQHRFSLPMNRRLVAMSRTGERGADATIQLREMGFNAVNFEGGLEAWAASGFPVVTDDDTSSSER